MIRNVISLAVSKVIRQCKINIKLENVWYIRPKQAVLD